MAFTKSSLNIASFLAAFVFVWLVFDNAALGLIVGLVVGGGSEMARRTTSKPD
ncbi:MAG: hypothetical protein V2I67_07440 [Thermoanaerobaculales bacterium]|jgi:hypothetical protein|nr:hypothetical protein [Thermoanaerobaculales bacterium]